MNRAALALADAWRKPYFRTMEDPESIPEGLRLDRRWCRGLIVPSAEHASRLVGELGVPAELVRVVPPGLAPRAEARPAWGAAVPVVGTAVAPDLSALSVFLPAARRVLDLGWDVEFLVASQDADPFEVRRAAREQGLAERVSLVDPAFLEARFWSVLDIFCHAAGRLASPWMLVRAMAEGIPSLAVRTAGTERLIEHGRSGLLVEPDDPVAMAAAIIRLLVDPPAAATLSRQAQQVIRARFSPDAEADRLAALYRSCVPSAPRSGG
jgi:glycosyltransferase involved in cell wall biosynthesis